MGNHERRDLLQCQSAKMAMDGPIAAEDQRRVGLVGGIEFVAREKVDARHLELPDIVVLGMKSQQGNGAHRATFAHATRKNKMRERIGSCGLRGANRVDRPGYCVPIFQNCHPERRRAAVARRSRRICVACSGFSANKPQVPPRGLKPLVGMTINKEWHALADYRVPLLDL